MRASYCPSGGGRFHSYGAYQYSRSNAEVCAVQHWCSHGPPATFPEHPRHTPAWLRARAGHVASNLCSVHTNWSFCTWYVIASVCSYSLLDLQSLAQVCFEAAGPWWCQVDLHLMKVWSTVAVFLLHVKRNQTQENVLQSFGFPLRAVANDTLLQFVTFFLTLPSIP